MTSTHLVAPYDQMPPGPSGSHNEDSESSIQGGTHIPSATLVLDAIRSISHLQWGQLSEWHSRWHQLMVTPLPGDIHSFHTHPR